jgi:hypothetical protein
MESDLLSSVEDGGVGGGTASLVSELQEMQGLVQRVQDLQSDLAQTVALNNSLREQNASLARAVQKVRGAGRGR